MRKYEVNIHDKHYSILVKKYTSESAELEINGEPYSVHINGMITGVVGNTSDFAAQLSSAPAAVVPVQPIAAPIAAVAPVSVPAFEAKPATTSSDGVICAPIPGSILVIKVKEGDEVKAGQLLLKMEAMKMENEIKSTCNGTVTAIKVNVGDSVNQGEVMVEIG